MQANTVILCNAKVRISKYNTPAPTYNKLKNDYCSTNNVEYKFWFCLDDVKHCVNGSKKKYALDLFVVSNTWPMKINTNLSRHEVLVLEDARFQMQ